MHIYFVSDCSIFFIKRICNVAVLRFEQTELLQNETLYKAGSS